MPVSRTTLTLVLGVLLTFAAEASAEADLIESLAFTGTATCIESTCDSYGSGALTGTYSLEVTTQTIVGAWSFFTPFGVISSSDSGSAAAVVDRFGDINLVFTEMTYTPVFSDFVQLYFPNTDSLELGVLATDNVSDACNNAPGGALGNPACYPDYDVTGATVATTVSFTGYQGGATSTPVPLPSGPPIAEVSGTIGGLGSQDYYSFLWAGGAFSVTASITGAPNSGASYLFSEGVLGSCSSGGSETLNSGDGFTNTIAIANLAAGQYCIGIDTNNPNDPAFALTFNTPVDGSTPEPSTLVLLFVGLATIGVRRLTKRNREHS
jgi:hypothetical protein